MRTNKLLRQPRIMHRTTILLLALLLSGCVSVGDFDSVPVAKLSVGDQSQTSEIGGFCWPLKEGTVCADPYAWPTPKVPMAVSSPVRLELSMPIPEKVKYIEYMVTKVSDSDLNESSSAVNASLWNIPVEHVKPIKPTGIQQLELELEPGLYALTFFGWWSGVGDSTHGFLIEVRP